ncbi:virulence RhuM family protein, partial [bacterium]|nr:virulence RhuM family protein [bacterium]
NYLYEKEISELNRIVVMFLDYAEDQARRRKQIFLNDWQMKLDDFLTFNERDVLPNAGKVAREDADKKAEQAYEEYAKRRRQQVEDQSARNALRELENTAKMVKQTKKRD